MQQKSRTLDTLALIAAGLCWALALAPPRVAAQAAETSERALQPGADTVVTVAEPYEALIADFGARKLAIEADTSLDEAVRTQMSQLYAQAVAAYQELLRVRGEATRLGERIDVAPERLAALRAAGEAPLVEPVPPARDASTDVLDQQLREGEAALDAAKRVLSAQESALSTLQKTATTLGADIAERRARVSRLTSEIDASVPPDTSPRMQEARAAALIARKTLREAEIELFQRQLGGQDILLELATLEREIAAVAVAQAQASVDALRAVVQRRREAEAEGGRAQAAVAKQTAARLPAEVAALAAHNLALSEELESITKRSAGITGELKAAQERATGISAELAATQQRVEVVGSTAAIGRMLRRRHADLPSLQGFRRAASERRANINAATDRQIDLDEQRRTLRDLAARADAMLASIATAPDAVTRDQIVELLTAQQVTVVELQKAYGRYLTGLTALDVAERQLVLAADSFLDFIDEQLLWIQSIPRVSPDDIAVGPAALQWLSSPQAWARALNDILVTARERPLRIVLGTLAVIVVFLVRRAARDRLVMLSNETRRIRTDRFAHTLKALFYTASTAGAWPLLMVVLGWWLAAAPTADAFTLSVAAGLFTVAAFHFTLDSLRRMCRTDGLGDRHFRWPEPVRRELARGLRRFILIGIPLVFLVAMTGEYASPEYLRGVGRPAFVVLMLALVQLVATLFSRSSAFVGQFDHDGRPNRVAQLRFLWFPALIALPLVNAVLSLIGYHHSALEIERQLRETAWLGVGLLIAREAILRMLYIAQRRLRLEDVLRRREEARAQREHGEAEAAAAVEEPDMDYADLGEQARRIVNIALVFLVAGGLWAIWNDLLPALGILDDVTLPMTTSQNVDGVERQVPVTLGDLAVALLTLAVAVFAAKNLTGLLEIAILQRLPLDPGGRYAIVTLAQYAIMAVGVIATFAKIGVEWSSLQWLVAALSVGLGFGLQEIVANFISGIILLLERPIRVGDLVTVGDVSGTVSRIKIRATTIVNFDKQELLVPNKEFITGRVLNWTLTDQLNRIVVKVGVAYGSNVEKALELLAEVAAEHPQVLAEPAPIMVFEQFGDNSLQLALRCYLATLEFRVATMTELHTSIHRKFNEAGIVIAFPQRDVHIDVMRPIEIRMNV